MFIVCIIKLCWTLSTWTKYYIEIEGSTVLNILIKFYSFYDSG